MTTRGRKPTPEALKLLRGGRARGKKARRAEANIEAISENPPPHLSEAAREFWVYFYRLLRATKVLTVLDAPALEMLAAEWALYREAADDLAENGKMVKTDAGTSYWSPSWAQYKHSQKVVTSLLSEFGMTPTARTRIHADLTQTANEFEGF